MLTRPDLLLRVEALLVLVGGMIAYSVLLHGSWLWFAVFFLAPDLSLAGYLLPGRTRMAAAVYNAVHSYSLPLILALVAWRFGALHYEQAAAIWIAHIAFDRFLGFGLKYGQAFKPTHLQSAAVFRAS
jgi:Domain of unknown function (DUF4260)